MTHLVLKSNIISIWILFFSVEPFFLDLPLEFEGLKGQFLNIQFSFCSYPRVPSDGIQMYRKGNVVFKPNGTLFVRNAMVQQVFYGREVKVDGQTLIWMIENVNEIFAGTYTVLLKNKDGKKGISFFTIKVKDKTEDDNSTERSLNIFLRWISPIIVGFVLVGVVTIIVKWRLKHHHSQEIQNASGNGIDVQSINGNESNLHENGEENLYCSARCSTDSENVNSPVHNITLIADSSFVTQASESVSTSGNGDPNLLYRNGEDSVNDDEEYHSNGSDKYEKLMTEEEDTGREYFILNL